MSTLRLVCALTTHQSPLRGVRELLVLISEKKPAFCTHVFVSTNTQPTPKNVDKNPSLRNFYSEGESMTDFTGDPNTAVLPGNSNPKSPSLKFKRK